MENQDSGSKWKEYSGKVPDPRPGTVNTVAETHDTLEKESAVHVFCYRPWIRNYNREQIKASIEAHALKE